MDGVEEGKVAAQEENGAQVNASSPVPVTVVMAASTPLSQAVPVQSVIQTNHQQSVIQPTPIVQVQVGSNVDEEGISIDGEIERRKRQEILSRRPSYRRILNDLSSDVPGVPKIEEEPAGSDESEGTQSIIVSGATASAIQNLPTGATIQIANPSDGVQGIQTLTMTNSGGSGIVQSIQTQDGQQFFVPAATAVNIARLGDVQAYQIRPATSLAQGVVMTAPANIQQQAVLAEEAGRKRELRLMKNREAAKECRRKKKEYIKCLENRVAVLENQNKTLIEELKSLKELYCHKSD